jgi:hypothetical protein
MYNFKKVGDVAWIAQNLQNMEDSIFWPKHAKHFNLDNSEFDLADCNNDNIALNIGI